jgi:hypothetical protein
VLSQPFPPQIRAVPARPPLFSVSQSLYQQLAMSCPALGLTFESAQNQQGVKVVSVIPGGLAEATGGFVCLSYSLTIGCARWSDLPPRFAKRRHHYLIRRCQSLNIASIGSNSMCASVILFIAEISSHPPTHLLPYLSP